jgi:hypothetical protein
MSPAAKNRASVVSMLSPVSTGSGASSVQTKNS